MVDVRRPDQRLASLQQRTLWLEAPVDEYLRDSVFVFLILASVRSESKLMHMEDGQSLTARIVEERTVAGVDVLQCDPDAAHEAERQGIEVNRIAMGTLLGATFKVQRLKRNRRLLVKRRQHLENSRRGSDAAHGRRAPPSILLSSGRRIPRRRVRVPARKAGNNRIKCRGIDPRVVEREITFFAVLIHAPLLAMRHRSIALARPVVVKLEPGSQVHVREGIERGAFHAGELSQHPPEETKRA